MKNVWQRINEEITEFRKTRPVNECPSCKQAPTYQEYDPECPSDWGTWKCMNIKCEEKIVNNEEYEKWCNEYEALEEMKISLECEYEAYYHEE